MAATVFQTQKVSRDEYSITHFQYLNNRGIEKMPTSQIYKQTLLSRINFLKGYKMKKVEGRHIGRTKADIYLLSRNDIRRHRSKYKFLHIGLVQVSIATESVIVPSGHTLHVSVSLRDSKYTNFQDSVLVSMESDLYQGTMKFNWFPNFSSPLSDLANSNALVVTVDPQFSQSGFRSLELEVRYRVCYKLMKTSLEPKYLYENPVLEVNSGRTNVVVPKSNNQT